MTNKINDKYIRDFFGIDDSPEGDEELAEIVEKLIRVKFENGEDICTIDGEPDGMFFLESGTAIVLGRDGAQLNIMHEGQYFGEYAVLAKQKRMSTVRSLGRTVCYKMETEDVMKILLKHPNIYGELMKRVYSQVSRKHSQVLALSGMRKGILQHPSNVAPMSKRQMLVQYGCLALIYLLAAVFIPKDTVAPVFILPLLLMLVYVLITKRTLESLIVGGILAALLYYRTGLSASYADAIMETMASPDNVFTVLVMALMGGMVTLIEASGGVTAFKKFAESNAKDENGVLLTSFGIMTLTLIDDGLNMLCASSATVSVAKEKRVVREKLGLLYSMLPTVLSSFFPLSLWGIFVIGTLNLSIRENVVGMFARSIPFNFFSLLVLLAMLMLCTGRLPKIRQLKEAEIRVKNGGTLWPAGSEKYLSVTEPEMWGKMSNVMLPIAALAVTSLGVRSFFAGGFIVDSAVGLTATLLFMFLLYCAQGLLTPEQFMEHLITGIANSALPIVMYLLTMCFSSLLEQLYLNSYFESMIGFFKGFVPILPAMTFLIATVLTIALGSSWAMYAIIFPIALKMAFTVGLNPALVIGAVAGAGIAGEKLCIFTADALNVGTAVGCGPGAIMKIRVSYSAVLTGIAAVMYLIAGVIIR
ncbi:MAG: cyclic nucleotide-binding domain-containing protein [Lachnospiraceae bacterium]|nr:cyclic nucleotide-binding domain-containing protein [Lachnospiraceae bacterium]